ncbi:DUF4271 domain-containing protein [Polaribacter glomeratus]|uniref:DUF4271 domain-containing protein n=1 Tax=Polaribacter glomeratus TaxID=102 RepID=A0A2S7WGU2_9FLAO|nr:DUF4271 domain-containing protein [Polaribacter glomeratus]PQJ76833.1 DUF4271 domain-containing protein [Polaribacter glomeratus]TXD67323.1 DUF4271 domain-containing protein [Polaribacter glomeratus]
MQAIEKIITTNSWVTALILLLFISIVLLKALDTNRLKGSVFSLFNINYIETESEEISSFLDPFKVVMFLFTVVVLSLLTYSFKTYNSPTIAVSFASYVPVFLSLLSYFVIKRTLEYLLFNLFLIKKEVRLFVVSKVNYLHTVTFLLYVAIVLSEYAGFKQRYLFYLAALLFSVRFIIHLVINKNLIFNKLFYFILYICAFEIAPLFLLFKMMF